MKKSSVLVIPFAWLVFWPFAGTAGQDLTGLESTEEPVDLEKGPEEILGELGCPAGIGLFLTIRVPDWQESPELVAGFLELERSYEAFERARFWRRRHVEDGMKDEALWVLRHETGWWKAMASDYRRLARTLSERGLHRQAVEIYRVSIALHPSLAETLAEVETRLGDLDGYRGYRGNVLTKGDLYRELVGELRQLEGGAEAAVGYLREVLQADEQADGIFLHQLGLILLFDLERADHAADVFRRALALRPRNADLHYRLGIALRRLERWNEAAGSLGRAVELEPENPPAFAELAWVLYHLGEEELALVSSREAIALDPSIAWFHRLLGWLLDKQGRTDEAVIAFRRATELAPDNAKNRNYLGWALLRDGRVEEAIGQYLLAVEPMLRGPVGRVAIALRRVIEAGAEKPSNEVGR